MTGRIARPATVFVSLLVAAASGASPLFDDVELLEIGLRGPLGALVDNKTVREEYPFELEVDGRRLDLEVRVRGNSRIEFCRFPPLRLNFKKGVAAGTVFEGQDKLKLVTHCRHDDARAENNVLDEYAAYRVFNLISPQSYRVRLVRVRYEDTDARLRNIERSYYAFLIEPTGQLAGRLGGDVIEHKGVNYPRLDAGQTARMYVFQYLIGNTDYSLVTAESDEFCCHNLDLIGIDGRVFPIPYDFDLSGLVNARYARPRPELQQRRITQRRYVGYCSSDIETIAAAVQAISAMRDEILSGVAGIPALKERYGEDRLRYVEGFFDVAAKEQRLLNEIARDCIGRDYGSPLARRDDSSRAGS